jgi:hypothetical protein
LLIRNFYLKILLEAHFLDARRAMADENHFGSYRTLRDDHQTLFINDSFVCQYICRSYCFDEFDRPYFYI